MGRDDTKNLRIDSFYGILKAMIWKSLCCPRGEGEMKRPSIRWFVRNVLNRKLYPYQEIIGEAILDSILNEKGLTITVMLARQTGKNELSAIIETYLLACMEQGTIIKAAPTFSHK